MTKKMQGGTNEKNYSGEFACSMLAARRIFQQAPNHQLGTLVRYANIPSDGNFHRALYDAEMTAKLWSVMLEDISERHVSAEIAFSLIKKLTKTPKASVDNFLKR